MYKMNYDETNPEGNFVTQVISRTLIEVEVKMVDNRNPSKGAEDFVFFLEDDEEWSIKERVEIICNEMGYSLFSIGEYRREMFTYEVGKTMIRLAQQKGK